MQQALYAAPEDTTPSASSWVSRNLEDIASYDSFVTRKYKPVHRKVRPVPSYMPEAASQVFKPIPLPDIPPLPLQTQARSSFTATGRLSKDRLDAILNRIPPGFLLDKEVELLIYVLQKNQTSLAWDDSERGTFSPDYFPDYEIPVIEHTPWVQPAIRVPKAIEDEVKRMIIEQKRAGKFETSTASYRSRIFAVEKKPGSPELRLVNDVQELNRITVRDSALPPRPDDFAEKAVGRVIYGLIDLFAGYDNRRLAEKSRPLTTFNCILGPHRNTTMPQGATNSLPEFQRCIRHVLEDEIQDEHSDAFVDDVTAYGPASDYDNEEMKLSDGSSSGIRRFVYEYAVILNRLLIRFAVAGVTASGKKLIVATPMLQIVGSVVSKDGWHLSKGIVAKVLKWPEPRNVSEVRAFLGTAGVGRRWIKDFSVIARPLTVLTRVTAREFIFEDEERNAFEKLKKSLTEAPVLIKIDYKEALTIKPGSQLSDEGLVIVAVDSCSHGAGWVLLQIRDGIPRPAIFGSCTFSNTESRYSQPKAELYGLFRAIKDLRHRIWGLHFRIDVDAKFLIEMLETPDLPNAPMTRWVTFLRLFDFTLNYVPADKHKVPDGLSRRPKANDDSEDSDPEEVIEKFIGLASRYSDTHHPFSWNGILKTVELQHRTIPPTPFGTFRSTMEYEYVSALTVGPYEEVLRLPSEHRLRPSNYLPTFSMLKYTSDGQIYTAPDFHDKSSSQTFSAEISIGDDNFDCEFSTMVKGFTASDSVHPVCVAHASRIKETDDARLWADIRAYFKDGLFPDKTQTSNESRMKFIRKTKRFVLHDDRLWLTVKGKPPRLLIEIEERRKQLISEAHNDTGHRGRDATYKLLTDRFYWPNMYDSVAYFVRSCNACQLRSRFKPKVPYEPTWNTAILRRFDLDTIHMEPGYGGKNYLLQALEPSIDWPEARAAKNNDSKTWAKFLYEEIICRFGCIPMFVVDNGSEFKGTAEILFKQYGAKVIFSSPYHPQGNARVERAHQTLVNSIRRSCGKDSSKWPLMLHACLLAMRCTTTRVTGYSPYYLLYGRQPLLSFDILDRSWEFLDWHKAKTTDELIALRAQQLARREKELAIALEQQKESRRKAVEDFNKRYEKRLVSNDFDIGTWVLVHETWLDGQKGNKGALRWSGPFIVHQKFNNRSYRLREIDGTIRRDTVDRHRLKIFYYRDDYQTIKSVGKTEFTAATAMNTISDEAKLFLNGIFSNQFRGTEFPSFLLQKTELDIINDSLSRVMALFKRGRSGRALTIGDLLEEGDITMSNFGTRLEDPKDSLRLTKVRWTSVELVANWAADEAEKRGRFN